MTQQESRRWVVVFRDDARMMQIRADPSRRDAHVAYVRAHPELRIGGGLRPNPEADFCGALWVVEVATRGMVEALITADPFFLPEWRTYEIYTWGKILEDETVLL
ncbi:YciI family protein [Pseudophaeobacter sp.]|uniref:YciI family protein n=1 Tax=Pseudophaeobacter sp. TaxID=1971739 RepID=UPI0040590806